MILSRSEDILNFLSQPHTYPPTVREIGTAVGLKSSASVHVYLRKLEEQGFIKRKANSPRCISVVRSNV